MSELGLTHKLANLKMSLNNLLKSKGFFSSLHIFVLCSFAFAQPLFDLLGRQAEFFAIRRSEPVDILLLIAGLIIVIPAIFIAIQAIVGILSQRLRTVVHIVMIACLTAIIFLPLLKNISGFSGILIIALSCVIGIAFSALYIFFKPVKTFLTVLSPALIIFPVLFVFNSPVHKIVFPKEVSIETHSKIDAKTPIVMVVFDELPVTSLMDEHGQIDPVRYPNFAALAKDSNWFRNATTSDVNTEKSITTILTGVQADIKKLPTVADYPDNLMTLLSDSYNINAFEGITQFCPERICIKKHKQDSLSNRMTSLFKDVSVVFGHKIIPIDMSSFLPSITQNWKDFANQPGIYAEKAGKTVQKIPDRLKVHEEFVELLQSTARPSLFFLHCIFPHRPWLYLPSGKQYDNIIKTPDSWSFDEMEVMHYYQRHLLQVGFTDKLLGTIISRLKAVGLYDNSLIIITADHGVSFKANDESREITKTNYSDIFSIPLLIKQPNQHRGEIIDSNAQTIDIIPTIAEVLNIKIPWNVEGQSLLMRKSSDSFSASIRKDQILSITPIINHQETLHRKIKFFGSGSYDKLFHFNHHSNLIGMAFDKSKINILEGVKIKIDSVEKYQNVDLNENFVPCLIKGSVFSQIKNTSVFNLIMVINGNIKGTTLTYRHEQGSSQFAAIVPETAFKNGENIIEAYVIAADDTKPQPLFRKSAFQYGLSESFIQESPITESSKVNTYHLIPGALNGTLDAVLIKENKIFFAGWAANIQEFKLPKAILIFVNGKFFYKGETTVYRPDVVKHFNNNALYWAGFRFNFPLTEFERLNPKEVRLFAISNKEKGSASELHYFKGYKWRTNQSRKLPETSKQITMELPKQTKNNYLMQKSPSGEDQLISAEGKVTKIIDGILQGSIDNAFIRKDKVIFEGWAADIKKFDLPETILAFADKKLILSGSTGKPRPDVVKHFGNDGLLKSGFSFDVPASLFKNISNSDIRFFAVSKDGVASELNYNKDYKWRKKN